MQSEGSLDPPLVAVHLAVGEVVSNSIVLAQTMSPLRHTIGFQGAHACRALGLWLTGCLYAQCQRFRVNKLSICRPNPGWQAWCSRHALRWVQEWCWRWTFFDTSIGKSHLLQESEHNRGMFCIIRRRVSAHRFHVVFPCTTSAPWWEWCQSASPRALIVLESILLLEILSLTRRFGDTGNLIVVYNTTYYDLEIRIEVLLRNGTGMDPQGCCWWGRIAPMTRMDKGGDFAVRALLHPLQGHWLCAQEGATGQWCAWFSSEFGQTRTGSWVILRTEFPCPKPLWCWSSSALLMQLGPREIGWEDRCVKSRFRLGALMTFRKSQMTLYIMICRETVYTTGPSKVATRYWQRKFCSFNGLFWV